MRVSNRRVVPWIQALLLSLLCVGTFAAGLTGEFVLDDQLSPGGASEPSGAAADPRIARSRR
jgi:hypothetical protein